MGFGTNYKAAEEFDLIPVGEYETVITNAGVKQTKNGAYKVAFTLTIRNDVQQHCTNRTLFLDIWRKKEPNDNDNMVDGFNFAQLMGVAKAAQIPDGTNFETLEQFLRALIGRCIRVTVLHREYNGAIYENIDQLRGLHPTKFPECRHQQKQRPQTQSPAYNATPQPYSQPPMQQYQQPQMQQYAQPQQIPQPPMQTAPPAPATAMPQNLSEFESILTDGDVPF